MSTERDELAELLAKHEDCAFSASGILVCACGVALQPQEVMDDMSNLAAHQADMLTAAGYSKPQTITTAEELDGLPEGTTIVDQAERLTLEETSIQYLEWVDRHGNACHVELPATVLYEPQP